MSDLLKTWSKSVQQSLRYLHQYSARLAADAGVHFVPRPDTATYTSMKFSPKTIDYTLQKKGAQSTTLLYKKGAKSSSSVYEKVQRGPFPLSERGAATVRVPGDRTRKKHDLYKRARRPNNSGMKY
ncbi:hypothetical protein QQF64_024925 [Cirrhinus molitorella]|uniref:Uncharacterized protein n=1 Tax=Cirrhinus molitorella TaxID=172907 RepID=A0ABR3NMM0_9TELE